MRIFDGHVHLADAVFDPDRAAVYTRLRACGVAGLMVICDPGDLSPDHERAVEIVRNEPDFLLSVACHPQNALHFGAQTKEIISRVAGLPFCACIGETGLDYYDNRSTREEQMAALNWHLDLALEMGLPVQLHIRDAHGDMTRILTARREAGRLPLCIAHCYTRSWELARVYLKLGLYLSVGGPVTYENAAKLPETVQKMPPERLLIETDAPWTAPQSHRGTRNEPALIVETLNRIAALRGLTSEAAADVLWENARRVYGARGPFKSTQN